VYVCLLIVGLLQQRQFVAVAIREGGRGYHIYTQRVEYTQHSSAPAAQRVRDTNADAAVRVDLGSLGDPRRAYIVRMPSNHVSPFFMFATFTFSYIDIVVARYYSCPSAYILCISNSEKIVKCWKLKLSAVAAS